MVRKIMSKLTGNSKQIYFHGNPTAGTRLVCSLGSAIDAKQGAAK